MIFKKWWFWAILALGLYILVVAGSVGYPK
jgi:hypothetical protein